MGKHVAILQSGYIPWKGYFHVMKLIDEFVLYDDVRFTKNYWRNSNRIKTPQGLKNAALLKLFTKQKITRKLCAKTPKKIWTGK